MPLFGLLRRGGRVYAVMIPDAKSRTLLGIIRERIRPDSIVYTDTFGSYDALDLSKFHHQRINHSEAFVIADNHINGIENFWSQAKRHLRRYNGAPRAYFVLFLKKCEWCFNYRPSGNLLKQLNTWDGLQILWLS